MNLTVVELVEVTNQSVNKTLRRYRGLIHVPHPKLPIVNFKVTTSVHHFTTASSSNLFIVI